MMQPRRSQNSRRSRKLFLFSSVVATALALSLPLAAQNATGWDAKFRAIPDAKNIGEYMKRMSARPHHVGSPYDKDNAEWILARFKEWGWDAQIETFDVLFPTPKERVARDDRAHALHGEARGAGRRRRPDIGPEGEQLPSFNAYSIDGDVTGPLVYVNYGLPAGLRGARSPRHLREGRDRHRALRRVVARHQAEGRRRARRHRLPDLLRSAGRRLLHRRRVSGRARCATATASSAAA